jgi:hypothetical protein
MPSYTILNALPMEASSFPKQLWFLTQLKGKFSYFTTSTLHLGTSLLILYLFDKINHTIKS